MRSEQWEALLQLPLCHVPAGSGNGLASSCGLWSPVTAAHALVKGATALHDAATLYQPSQRRSSLIFLSVQCALIATVDIGTESLRRGWQGLRKGAPLCLPPRLPRRLPLCCLCVFWRRPVSG